MAISNASEKLSITLRGIILDSVVIDGYGLFEFTLTQDQPRPQIRRDYPLNLSISISGGKETNQDSLSNGERTGNSSNFKSRSLAIANCSFQKRYPHRGDRSKLLGTAYQRG